MQVNEASLTICRMVWAELKLEKVVDWTTLKAAPGIHIPTQRDIPRGVLKFPEGGLSIKRMRLVREPRAWSGEWGKREQREGIVVRNPKIDKFHQK
jgi:hypothetical protein